MEPERPSGRARSPPFSGVLLDLYGTLVPTGSKSERMPHLFEMAKALGVSPSAFEQRWTETFDERARGAFGPTAETLERLARELGAYPSGEGIDRAVRVRQEFTREILRSSDPLLPDLDVLRKAGLRLALVTDTSEETPRLWRETPLSRRFDATVFSCEEGFRKPDPRMYATALRRLDLSARECAYVGDGGSRELTGARAVGLSPFLYRFPGEDPGSAFRIDAEEDWGGPRLATLRDLLQVTTTRPA